jgi:hypothetical protein
MKKRGCVLSASSIFISPILNAPGFDRTGSAFRRIALPMVSVHAGGETTPAGRFSIRYMGVLIGSLMV